MTSCKWIAPVFGLGALGVGVYPLSALSQTFIGNPTQGNGWSTTSAVSIVAHSGEAGGRPLSDIINGSGLDNATGQLHISGNPFGTMGLARNGQTGPGGSSDSAQGGTVPGSHWIQFGFDQPYQLGNLFVWNWNEDTNPPVSPGFGWKNVTIQTSMTGGSNPAEWTTAFTGIIGKAPGGDSTGTARSPANSIIDLGGVTAKYVTMTAAIGTNQNWSNGVFNDSGLSEVRFAQFDPAAAVGWKNDASGDWNDPANWRQGFAPTGPTATALFGDRITAPRTVYADSPVSVGTITFDCNSSYLLTGQGTLTLAVNSGSAAVEVLRGNHKINLPLNFSNDTDVTVPTGSTLTIADPTRLEGGITLNKNGAGTMTVLSTLSANSAATIKLNGGVVNLDAASNDPDVSLNVDPATINLGASQTLGSVVLSAGGNLVRVGRSSSGSDVPATLTMSSLQATAGGATNTLHQTLAGNTVRVNGALQIDAGTKLAKQGTGVLIVGSVAIDPTGQLDIGEGKMVIDYGGSSPLVSDIIPLLTSGRSGGAWNGNGVNSSTAAADAAHKAVGYAEASDLGIGSFGGVAVDTDAIVLRATYKGDANLDGAVTSDDFNALVAGFGITANGLWVQGDFNYDQKVNTLDFNDLAGNFGAAVLPAPTLAGVVPEPASLGLLGAAGLLLRRRR